MKFLTVLLLIFGFTIFLSTDISAGKRCTYDWCDDFCSKNGFPTKGCDPVSDNCKCGSKLITNPGSGGSSACTTEWCNDFCSSRGYPTKGCDGSGTCQCGPKSSGGSSGCTAEWCNDFCTSRGFPVKGCDSSNKCQCASKPSTDCTWCDDWCSEQGYPKGSCSNGKCTCGSRSRSNIPF